MMFLFDSLDKKLELCQKWHYSCGAHASYRGNNNFEECLVCNIRNKTFCYRAQSHRNSHKIIEKCQQKLLQFVFSQLFVILMTTTAENTILVEEFLGLETFSP